MKNPIILHKISDSEFKRVDNGQSLTHEELLKLIVNGDSVKLLNPDTLQDITMDQLLPMLINKLNRSTQLASSEFVQFLVRSDEQVLNEFFHEFLPTAIQLFQNHFYNFRVKAPSFPVSPLNCIGERWFPWIMGVPSSDEKEEHNLDELKDRIEHLEEQLKLLK